MIGGAFMELFGCIVFLIFVGIFIALVMCEWRLSRIQRMIEDWTKREIVSKRRQE